MSNKQPRSSAEKITIAVIAAICLFIIVAAIATSHPPNSSTPDQSGALTAQQIQNCENTPQKQLYQTLLAQEQAGGISGNLVTTLAQLAPEVSQQQLRCEAGLPAN